MAAKKDPSAEDRIDAHLKGRLEDIRKLWDAQMAGQEDVEDLGNLNNYGLAFDYVEGGTDYNHGGGYFRWQLSWGGPSDEFRFYTDTRGRPYSIEYAFLDWFDGAKRKLTGANKQLLGDIFEDWKDMGVTATAFEDARGE